MNRVGSGWSLRAANRGVSGSPPGSKIGLGAGRAGRVHLAALVSSFQLIIMSFTFGDVIKLFTIAIYQGMC